MGDRQVSAGRSESLKEFTSFVVKDNGRPATRCSSYFYVLPGDAPVPPRADGFHRGFLGCETGGVTFYLVGFCFAVADFFGREDAFQESSSEAIDGGGDAGNFCDINAGADDHKKTAFRLSLFAVRPNPSSWELSRVGKQYPTLMQ